MRLDKLLAHKGYGTRKEVKKIIKQGNVLVNQQVIVDDNYKVNLDNDVVKVFDEVIQYQKYVYIMLNKPSGYVCATSDLNHPTVIELINQYYVNLSPVGRLDLDTEGLLLLTNDGQFAHQVISNKKFIPKVYYVELLNDFDISFIKDIENGIWLNENEQVRPAKIEIVDHKTIYLTITEGKYHQIKRMNHSCNNEVSYLKRVKIGQLELDNLLELGEYRFLSESEKMMFK